MAHSHSSAGTRSDFHNLSPPSRSRWDEGTTVPPASPQRAGHYAGLHPEDQPYQSTVLPAQHLLALQAAARLPATADVEPIPSPTTSPHLDDQPTYVIPLRSRERPPELPPAGYQMRPKRLLPAALTLICLLLLVGGSLTAYALLNKRPAASPLVLTAMPTQLRAGDTLVLSGKGFGINDPLTFYYDRHDNFDGSNGRSLQAAHADDLGTFNVDITIPDDWTVGQHTIYVLDIGKTQSLSAAATITVLQSSLAPPQLALTTTQLNLGAAAPGVINKQVVTLTNAGGRSVNWQASSDQPWLSITPQSGTFSGSGLATILVNRGACQGGSCPQGFHTGHITFTQQGKVRESLTLTVDMRVTRAPPASLAASTGALAYLGSQAADPAPQFLTLQNASTQAIDWSSAIYTSDGFNWLSISPSTGRVNAHSSETVAVYAQSLGLTPGVIYQGTIGFKGGMNPIVTVTLSVVAPGYLAASPPSLSFSAVGQNPRAQTITLQNSGGETVAWSASASTLNGGRWLSAAPAAGYITPGGAGTVSIAVNANGLAPRSYQGTITLSYNGAARQISIALTVSVPPSPAISVSQSGLNFTTITGTDPTPQTFNVTNSGSSLLHWAASASQTSGGPSVQIAPASGSLNPGQSAAVTVSPGVTGLAAGSYSSTLTVSDSDSGTKVTSQSVSVSITIKDQANIILSLTSMTFNESSSSPSSTQLVTITNNGSQALNWAAQSSAAWLSSSITSGSLATGDNAVISVQSDASTLTAGTYTATLTFSDTDTGTTVAPQTLTVTLTVS